MLLRRTASGAALLMLLGLVHPAIADEGDETMGPSEPEAAPAAASGDSDGATPVKQSSSRKRRGKSRGKHGAKFAGRVVPEEQLRTEPLPRPSGNLHIVSAAHATDQAKVNIYNADGSYNL